MLKGDCTVAFVTFNLAPLIYRNSLSLDYPTPGFVLKSIQVDIDQAITVLIVDVDDKMLPIRISMAF